MSLLEPQRKKRAIATISPAEVPTAKQVEPKRIASSFDWSQWWLELGVVIGAIVVLNGESIGQKSLQVTVIN